jgi:hypothetical protein
MCATSTVAMKTAKQPRLQHLHHEPCWRQRGQICSWSTTDCVVQVEGWFDQTSWFVPSLFMMVFLHQGAFIWRWCIWWSFCHNCKYSARQRHEILFYTQILPLGHYTSLF